MFNRSRSSYRKIPFLAALLMATIPGSIIADTTYSMKFRVGGLSQTMPPVTFTDHTFTHCNGYGRTGPTESSCLSHYSEMEITKPEYNFQVIDGIQQWTVPATGSYEIEAFGARGGSYSGGKGARVKGTFDLVKGQEMRILVGQLGGRAGGSSGGVSLFAGSGGGATFVVIGESTPLLVAAGGGGGASSDVFGGDGDSRQAESPDGATGGCSPGAGFTGNGGRHWGGVAPMSFINGGTGGQMDNNGLRGVLGTSPPNVTLIATAHASQGLQR